ncbi:hypothetical protein DDQ50_08555 [Amnibacterium flavum]|uniref:Uncharacterized protein n=1 Tax=Amnibacterium flavum TaxID=2173173 RepID=A0A2V1HQH4_9MICO|nr:hypothetical protein DDQ50_08555 [Amnibacterium flavum]
MLGNAFKRSPWQIFGLIVGIVYGVGIAFFAVVALIGLRFADPDIARNSLIIAGSVVVLGFTLVPLVLGIDDTLDPRRFALFGIDNRRLAVGLIVAAMISIPSLAITAIALASVITWTRDVGTTLIALVSALAIVATCVLASRVTTSVAAYVLSTRRAREFTALVGILVIVMISPVVIILSEVDWGRDGARMLGSIADGLAWTPLGAVWAAPGDAATGEWGLAFLHLLIALATVGLLWLAWQGLLARMLVTPEREGRAKKYEGLGWFDRLPANPGGAIAARTATYWLRDPRYRNSLFIIPISAIALTIPFVVVGVPHHVVALVPVPVFALLLGWSVHNDVAYDNTAVWLHVASGTRGRADRLGRLFPALVIGIPVIVAGSFFAAWYADDWSLAGALIGVGIALLFSGFGLSSVSSARFPYPVVRPGDGAFSQPQNTGATMALAQSIIFVSSVILSLPTIGLAALGFFYGGDWYMWALLAGVGTGLLVLIGGVALGSRIFSRRGPEMLASALLNS